MPKSKTKTKSHWHPSNYKKNKGHDTSSDGASSVFSYGADSVKEDLEREERELMRRSDDEEDPYYYKIQEELLSPDNSEPDHQSSDEGEEEEPAGPPDFIPSSDDENDTTDPLLQQHNSNVDEIRNSFGEMLSMRLVDRRALGQEEVCAELKKLFSDYDELAGFIEKGEASDIIHHIRKYKEERDELNFNVISSKYHNRILTRYLLYDRMVRMNLSDKNVDFARVLHALEIMIELDITKDDLIEYIHLIPTALNLMNITLGFNNRKFDTKLEKYQFRLSLELVNNAGYLLIKKYAVILYGKLDRTFFQRYTQDLLNKFSPPQEEDEEDDGFENMAAPSDNNNEDNNDEDGQLLLHLRRNLEDLPDDVDDNTDEEDDDDEGIEMMNTSFTEEE